MSDPKKALCFKSYAIFSNKLVMKSRRVDLGKNKKNPSGEFLFLSFAVKILKIGHIEKMQKNYVDTSIEGTHSKRNTPLKGRS